MQISFCVQDETAVRYEVTFTKDNDEINVTCTCQSADTHIPCEHHINILEQKVETLVSDNVDDVAKLEEWLEVSMLGLLYNKHKEADCAYLEALDRVHIDGVRNANVDAFRSRLEKAKSRLSRIVKAP